MRTAGQLSHLVTIDFQSKTIRTGQEDPVAAPLCWVIGWIIYDNLREMLQETKFSCHEKMEKKNMFLLWGLRTGINPHACD